MSFIFNRIILTLAGIFFFTASFAQPHGKVKYLRKDNYGSVYVTKDTTLREYNWLSSATVTEEALSTYKESFDFVLKDTLVPVRHFSINEKLLVKWAPLYIYDDKFYVYSPSDWMSHFNYLLTDSSIIELISDGPNAKVLLDYQEISANDFRFKYLIYGKQVQEMKVKIIDQEKQIILWGHQLLVNSANVKEFPMVKCDCGNQKCLLEFEFHKVDEELIRRKGW